MSWNAETPGVTPHRPPDGHFFIIPWLYMLNGLSSFIAFIPSTKPWQLRSTAITAHFIQGPPSLFSFLPSPLLGWGQSGTNCIILKIRVWRIFTIHEDFCGCGVQTSLICGVIDDRSRSFKAIDERVFTNFRDKNAVFTNFRAKNTEI